MKPIELELAWFGQYTAPQVVRFAELDRVFLVTGETGAGKTTLFDAMTYALYGRGLGARAKGAGLRSQLAGREDTTLVRFRFEVRGQTWEAERSPHRFVPGRRGGHIEDKYAVLRRLDVDAPPVVDPREVNGAIGQAVGLEYEDFSRILVLPQGEFQAFLAMSSKDRAALLKTLFPVARHDAIARWAKDEARAVADQVRDLEARWEEAKRECDPLAFEAQDAALGVEVAGLRASEEQARAVAEAATAKLHAGRTLAGQIAKLVDRRSRLDGHEATREAHEARVSRLDAARRATAALPALDRHRDHLAALSRLDREIASAQELLAKARGRVDALAAERGRIDAREAALVSARSEHEALGRRVEGLRAWAVERDAADAARAASEAAAAAEAAAREALVAAEAAVTEIQQIQAMRDEARPALDAAREWVTKLQVSRADADGVTRWTSVQAPDLRAQRAVQDAKVQAAASTRAEAERSLAAARAEVEADAALHLAGNLVAGDPCPVCGATEHPRPRAGQPGTGDALARREAAEVAVEAATRLVVAESRAAAAMEAQEAAERGAAEAAGERLRAAGHADVAGWQRAVSEAEAALAPMVEMDGARERALRARPAREKVLVAARAKVSALEATSRARAAEAADAAARADVLVQALGREAPAADALAVATAAHARASDAIASEDRALRKLREDLGAADTARAGAEANAMTLARQREALGAGTAGVEAEAGRALAEAGFQDGESARLAAIDAREMARVEREVAAWAETARDLAREIAQLVEGIAGREAPVIATLETAEREATEGLTRATEARVGVEQRREQLGARYRRVIELQKEHDRVLEGSRGLLAVSRRLNGEVAPKIDFATWMLTWWLERVLVRANQRMRALSDGRYLFRLRTEVRDHRSAGGLDLDVLDTWSNQLRDVRALSGGETFLASLSLALGLADVVSSLHGGVQMDTLFIDEGFGSLDAETLQRAMDLVEQVAEHRSVGLISHVEAMQKAIRSKVVVRKSPRGSTLRVEGGRG